MPKSAKKRPVELIDLECVYHRTHDYILMALEVVESNDLYDRPHAGERMREICALARMLKDALEEMANP